MNIVETPKFYTSRGFTVWYKHISIKLLTSNFTFGNIPKGNVISISKWSVHPDVHCSITDNSQDVERTVVFAGR